MEPKYHILSTALLPAEALAQLSERGFSCEQIPFIRTETRIRETEKAYILEQANRQRSIIFTSAQAIEAVSTVLAGFVPDWTIFCISGATRKAAEQYFGAGAIRASANDATELAEKITAGQEDMIFFCGNKRLDTLFLLLAAKGTTLQECVVYHTEATPVATGGAYDALLFFSPSGVESFFSVNTIRRDTILFSIGHTTAKALAQQSNNTIIVPAQPDKHALVQTLIDYYAKQNTYDAAK